jgi:hypothetical protein
VEGKKMANEKENDIPVERTRQERANAYKQKVNAKTQKFQIGDRVEVISTGKKAKISDCYYIYDDWRYDLSYTDGGRAEGFLEGTLKRI